MAVLTGLCRGGHLDSARRFVDEGAPWGSLLWPRSRSIACDSPRVTAGGDPISIGSTLELYDDSGSEREFVFYPLPTHYDAAGGDDDDDRNAVASGGDFTVGRLESEFWGDKGIPALLDIVAERGHLDTLKWALSRFGGTDESWFLKRLLSAAKGFQFDTIEWLANTIDSPVMLTQIVEWWWGVPCCAYDIRRLMKLFPEWRFDPSNMAQSAVKCKGSAHEIIAVCEWLMQRFPSEKMDFTDSRNCENVDDVELAEWLLRRATPTESDFKCACRHRKDNVDIAEVLLEEVFFNLTETAPTLSLSKLLEYNIATTKGVPAATVLSQRS
ncbi:hypothetical protein Pelo_16474 [Pelomyxa schiedti]|nr:hypothetical protein Pelo_16474 [Pelomyxa schiedti]